MIFVDTGYFLALADPHDQHHVRAEAWDAEINDLLLLTEYVLVEVVNSLSRLGFRERAHKIVQSVTTDDGFVLVPASQALLMEGLLLHKGRPDKEWSLTDCISFEVMRSKRITRALTYDHHFEQAGFEAL